jgi:hypothetical protein
MAAEPVYVPQAVWVKDNVYAIVGPLGQRSSANAGLNANYGFVVTAQGVILIDKVGAAARNMDPMDATLKQWAQPAQFMHLQNFDELHRANMNRVFVDFEANP